MSKAEATQSEVQKPVTGTVGFGFGQLNNPTPMWVTWIFRTEFLINKAALFWLGSTGLITGDNVKEFILALATIDLLVWGVGRFVGVSKSDFER